MTNSPTISVVMPVYNCEEFLRESIKSVLNQTFTDFEFLIIYDESSDNTASIIHDFQKIDSRIRILNGDKNGITGALNKGIKESKGHYIIRQDADDISFKERFEIQHQFIVKNNFDICGGDYISIREDNSTQKSVVVAKKNYEILLTMASNVPFAHPSVMIKKSFLDCHKLCYGAYGNKVAEDLDLWMQMYNKGARFGNVGSKLIKYRILNDSLSSINNKLIKKEVNKQFTLFVGKNHEKFRHSLELFCKESNNTDNIEKVAIKALFRYSNVNFDIRLIYRCWKNVSFRNFVYGFLSYINSIFVLSVDS